MYFQGKSENERLISKPFNKESKNIDTGSTDRMPVF